MSDLDQRGTEAIVVSDRREAPVRLLVVEDNPKLAGLIAKLLGDHAFAVDIAPTAGDARAALDAAGYDAVLLDLSLPDGDGTALLREIRRKGDTVPVIVATARGELDERIRKLNEGADDYLVKPFSLDELLARINAVLRRPRHAIGTVLKAGNVELDTGRRSVAIAGAPVELPRRELGLLETLMRQQGRPFSREKPLDSLYSFDAEVTPNALEAAVSRLRRRLEAHHASISVASLRGLGYILGPVGNG
jgi:DNA-binding response OmpR family regulator